jgi:hypothetical protein
MFIALSFIGKLPNYIIDCIYQARIFFKDDIYLIVDDLQSPYIQQLHEYNVKIIPYETVFSNDFLNTFKQNQYKFKVLQGLGDRSLLFIRCFERFFLLQNMMKQYDLTDCLFIELDNLIYDDPNNWLSEFSKSELCYMYDNDDRGSSGIMYVKNSNSLNNFLAYTIDFIVNFNDTTNWLTEMTVLYRFYKQYNDDSLVQILPTLWSNPDEPNFVGAINYHRYNNTIFDAAAIGVYLLGLDPVASGHSKIITKNQEKNKWSAIDCRKYKFEWLTDNEGRKIPHIFDGEKWIKINNLHVHSKDLRSGLSIPL